MERKFSLEQAHAPQADYRTQILKVLNALERNIRVVKVEGGTELSDILHKKSMVDARRENIEFEAIRTDIRETFAVPNDSEHIFVHDAHRGIFDASVKQRALRCFCAIFDALKHEGYYGEGRTIHNFLLNEIVELIRDRNKELSKNAIYEEMGTDTPRFIFVKGFMSKNAFSELPEKYRKDQEHPLVNPETGRPIETSEGWFISGNSLEDTQVARGDSRLVS